MSPATAELYDEKNIRYCMMDDFVGNLNDIKRGALNYSIGNYINERLAINLDEMLDHLYDTIDLGMSEKEKENFRRQLVGRIRIDL